MLTQIKINVSLSLSAEKRKIQTRAKKLKIQDKKSSAKKNYFLKEQFVKKRKTLNCYKRTKLIKIINFLLLFLKTFLFCHQVYLLNKQRAFKFSETWNLCTPLLFQFLSHSLLTLFSRTSFFALLSLQLPLFLFSLSLFCFSFSYSLI